MNQQLTALVSSLTPATVLAVLVATVGLLVIVTTLVSNRRQRRRIERLDERLTHLHAGLSLLTARLFTVAKIRRTAPVSPAPRHELAPASRHEPAPRRDRELAYASADPSPASWASNPACVRLSQSSLTSNRDT